ncbi:hypothetical protein ACM66B_004288 [Microbotryomycetes sp. NB124-2]
MSAAPVSRHKDRIQLRPTEAAGKPRLTGSAQPPPGLAINYNMDYQQSNKARLAQDQGLYTAPKPSQTGTRQSQAKASSANEDGSSTEATPATRRDKPFQPAFDAEADTSNRIESVFDLYADMTSGDEDESRSHAASEPTIAEEPEDDEPVESSTHNALNPWDTRGETGLYGGGGRGADDRETGWVSNYALQSGGEGERATGLEEDLRFEDEDNSNEHTRTNRLDSADTYRAAERRRSSEETEQSSYGPKTPVNAAFPASQVYAPSGYMSSSPTKAPVSEPKTPESRKEERRRFQVSKPSPANLKESISPPLSPGLEPDFASRQQQPTTPKTGFKAKFAPSSSSKNASAGLQIKHPHPLPDTPPPVPVHKVDPALLAKAQSDTPSPARRKSFKWTGRSKKTPQISAPILPQGFVESLGMETIPLTPGMKAPVSQSAINLPQTPPITPNGLGHQSPSGGGSNPGSDHQSPASSIRSAGNKINRKEAPRPQRIPNRPNYVPPRPTQLGDPIELNAGSLPKATTSQNGEDASQPKRPLASPIRLGPAAQQSLAQPSASSTSNSLAAVAQTRKLYLNGVKEERARQQEGESRSPLPPVPASPHRPQVSPSNSSHLVHSPLATPTKSAPPAATSSSGFRNPWGAAPSVSSPPVDEGIRDSVATSISSSDHFGTAHTTNMFHPTGSNRKQSSTSSSSKHTVDPRLYRATTTPSGYTASDLAGLAARSQGRDDTDEDEVDQESKRGRDARQSNLSGMSADYSNSGDVDYYHRNSTSSAYSDLSNFDAYPDLNNYAPNLGSGERDASTSEYRIGGDQSAMVAPKRGSRTSRGSAGADSFSHLRSTQPLNLSKKTTATTSSSSSAPKFAGTFGSAIGDTGFRNPFG